MQDITPDLAQQLGLNPDEQGVVISGVDPGSPAGEAGLRTGDVVKEVNRQEIHNLNDYNQALEKAKQDKSLLLVIKRGGSTHFVVLKSVSKG